MYLCVMLERETLMCSSEREREWERHRRDKKCKGVCENKYLGQLEGCAISSKYRHHNTQQAGKDNGSCNMNPRVT